MTTAINKEKELKEKAFDLLFGGNSEAQEPDANLGVAVGLASQPKK